MSLMMEQHPLELELVSVLSEVVSESALLTMPQLFLLQWSLLLSFLPLSCPPQLCLMLSIQAQLSPQQFPVPDLDSAALDNFFSLLMPR